LAAAHDSKRFVPSAAREADFGGAALRVVEAGQTLLVRRLELWVAEMRGSARIGFALLLAVFVGLSGWFILVAGVVDGLARHYPRYAVELSVGAFHLAIAGALVAIVQRAAAKLGARS
jgi:hypothetical protein